MRCTVTCVAARLSEEGSTPQPLSRCLAWSAISRAHAEAASGWYVAPASLARSTSPITCFTRATLNLRARAPPGRYAALPCLVRGACFDFRAVSCLRKRGSMT